jgi:hypothetical protein
MSKYTVIKDTREQEGWFFSEYDKCEGMELGTLLTGDYTIKGYEDVICVERKASVSEIAMNLGRKKEAFYKEVERMRDFPFRYILLEFSASDVIGYPTSLLNEQEQAAYQKYLDGGPKPSGKKFDIIQETKITGKYLIKCLLEISIKYEVNVIFCDNKHSAFLICNSIFKRLTELFDKKDEEDAEGQKRYDF